MQQKVALTAAHILGLGWVADMGMGSGTGSEALASLYPNIRVTGVDINPEMVERAAARYQRPNLDFRAGDISQPCFEPESLDAIFNSSVLHHVTSFNGYDRSLAKGTLESQSRQLKPYGSLIVRDFLRPEAETVWLELPSETAPLLEKFSREFQALKPPEERGFPLRELCCPEAGWQRFELDRVHAVEFVLRKDYQADWDTEVLEEYTTLTQSEFEQQFSRLGLRILASAPIRNPWIVNNRFEGKFRLFNSQGDPLEYPPTNYLIVGEKVGPGEGVRFFPAAEIEPAGYLEFAHYKHRDNGSLRDLVRRPNLTLDAVPYFYQEGELYVIARKSYPRPLLGLATHRLDGALSPTYVTEPLAVVGADKPPAQTIEEALDAWAGIKTDQLLKFRPGSVTYPSPGGLQEEVRSYFIETEPVMESRARDRVRAIEARQLLRAAQVGGLPDARLETHCFELMVRLGHSPGPWIGETLQLEEQSTAPPVTSLDELLVPKRRAFHRSHHSAQFLKLACCEFEEKTANGDTLRTLPLEYVAPSKLSLNTTVLTPLWKHAEEIYLGLANDDFPAAQCFSGHSDLLVAPAWRLPSHLENLSQALSYVCRRMEQQHGLQLRDTFELGGAYFPSPGVTPEIVHPYVGDVSGWEPGPEPLHWVSLNDLKVNFALLRDGHLKTIVSRCWRATSTGNP